MTQEPNEPSLSEVVTEVRINLATLVQQVKQALGFRKEFTSMWKTMQKQVDGLDERIRKLENTDTEYAGYFKSLAFVRDLIMGIALAIISAGVFWHDV